jgi:very-long-chain enoyl-CoA reductase
LPAVKTPIKKLPNSIQITDKTTVQDVKDILAKQAGGRDPNRFGLFDPEKKKILKDRKAFVIQSKEVMTGKEILVKDLGISQHPEQTRYHTNSNSSQVRKSPGSQFS